MSVVLNSVHSRTINNLESARISVPPLIKPAPSAAEDGGTDKMSAEQGYVWRVELEKTEPYWRGQSSSAPTGPGLHSMPADPVSRS